MLGKAARSRILERNWLDVEKRESNPYQFWHRIRDQANTGLRDLVLLANKLPEDKQDEIFNYINMKRLVASVLAHPDKPPDVRRTHLAALLVEEGLKVCIEKYESLLSETPQLTEPTIDHLKKTKLYCKEIAYAVDLDERKFVREQKELHYLFNWTRIPGSDNNKLVKFIKEEFGEFEVNWIKAINKQDEDNTIFFSYRNFPDAPHVFYIKLDKARGSAIAYNYDPDDEDEVEDKNKSKQITLVIKSQYDNLYVYSNKKSR
jgi:hypothetical protein